MFVVFVVIVIVFSGFRKTFDYDHDNRCGSLHKVLATDQ